MGLIGEALASGVEQAAGGLSDVMTRQIESRIIEDREKAMESFRNELRTQPLKRFGSEVSGAMSSQVPVTAAPVTSLTGDELGTPGISGDIATWRRQINNDPNMTDEDRNAALAQLDAQEAAANKAAQAKVAGQMRNPTRSEAESMAVQKLAAGGDYEAIAAGKGVMGDKYVKVGADEALLDPTTGKVAFQNTAGFEHRNALEDRKDARARERDDAREARLKEYLEKRFGSGENLTLSQQMRNREVDAARKYISGMTEEDIKRLTQQYTSTGRENKDYDPQLAARVRLANRRKYGDDPVFDKKYGLDDPDPADTSEPQPSAGPSSQPSSAGLIERFNQDQAMKSYKLGKQTPSGVEVLDANGTLKGYYR